MGVACLVITTFEHTVRGFYCILNFHSGRYIFRYSVGNIALNVISDRISDGMVIPILMHFCSFVCKTLNAACHPTKCDVINDVKLFATVFRKIYCHIF